MDYHTILAQRTLLARELTGHHVEALVRTGDYTLFLAAGGGRAFKLAAIPDMPYLAAIDPRFIPRKNARAWHQNRFEARAVTDIAITPGDRILTFTVEGGAKLIFELTGRHANIIIAGPDGVIAGALRQVTGKESGVRNIGPGIAYESPPHRDFADLAGEDRQSLLGRLDRADGAVSRAVRDAFGAGSRYFAAEVCARAGVMPDLALDELGGEDRAGLLDAAAALAREIGDGGRGGCVVYREDGLPHDVFPVPLTAPDIASAVYDSLDDAVHVYARDREIELERRSLRSAIIAALAAEERRIRGTIAKVERERGGGEAPGELERRANTILANLHRIPRGASTAVLADVYGEGEMTVTLDPALDGPGNAERLFKRARKRRAAAELADGRLADLTGRLEGVERDRVHADGLTDLRELRLLAAAHVRAQQSRRAGGGEDELFPRRFTSPTGLAIIVGRNDRENDDLVRWARKSDLWLHAQSVGGSHVVLRAPGKQAPDRRSIERAAAIAAYYSKAKTSAVVPVVCTQIRYVTKRKGQGPGKVTYIREEVLFVEPAKP